MRPIHTTTAKRGTRQKYNIPSAFFTHQRAAVQMAYRSAKSYYQLKTSAKQSGPHYRGGLVWHGTGSGKTITGLGIIMRYLKLCDMLEKRNIPVPYICVVTTQSNSRQNGMDKYLQNLMTYYPEFAHELARKEYPTIGAGETVRIFEALKNVFTKRVRFFNYVTFTSCAGLYRRNNIVTDDFCNEMRNHALSQHPWRERGMVLLLDESHELVKADLNDLKEGESNSKKNEYQAILRTKKLLEKNSRNPFFHTYCLTATPGTSIKEYVDTINLVRPVGQEKFKGPALVSGTITPPLKDYVHYVNLEKDTRYFAPTSKTTFQMPICKEHYLLTLGFIVKHLNKETNQMKKLEEGKKTGAQPAQLVYRHYTRESYLAHARRLENWISVSPGKNEFDEFVGGCSITGDKKFKKKVPTKKVLDKIATLYYKEIWKLAEGNIQLLKWIENIFPAGKAYLTLTMTTAQSKTAKKKVIVSPKLFRVAMNLHRHKGKQYVFSNDTGSNEIIAKMMDAAQYTNITESVRTLNTQYKNEQNNQGVSMLNNRMSGNSGTTSGQTRRSGGNAPNRNYILVRDKAGKDIETFQAYMSGLNMVKEGAKRVVESGTKTKFKRNAAGQACKIIFVTGELFTGTDINALRGVHILNPMASHISKVQAHGRASRSGGHAFLPESNQNSIIHTYASVVRQFQEKYKINVNSVMKCFVGDRKKTDKFMAALQWLQAKVKVDGILRVGGKNAVNTNNDSTFLPTADSATDAQQVYDYNTQKMLKFETSLKGRLRK